MVRFPIYPHPAAPKMGEIAIILPTLKKTKHPQERYAGDYHVPQLTSAAIARPGQSGYPAMLRTTGIKFSLVLSPV